MLDIADGLFPLILIVFVRILDNDVFLRIWCDFWPEFRLMRQCNFQTILVVNLVIFRFFFGLKHRRKNDILLREMFFFLLFFCEVFMNINKKFIDLFISLAVLGGWKIRTDLFVLHWNVADILCLWGHRIIKIESNHIKRRRKANLILLTCLFRILMYFF